MYEDYFCVLTEIFFSIVCLQAEYKLAKLRDYEEKLIVTAWYNKVGQKFTCLSQKSQEHILPILTVKSYIAFFSFIDSL